MTDPTESRLPHALALMWGVAPVPRRGPRRGLSIEQIAAAAVEIANAEGLAAVSMARVAASLRYTTMSLYRYVTSKDDLLLLMLEVLPPVELDEPPDDEGWRDGLRRWAWYVIEVYRAHPWRLDVPISGPPMTPASLQVADAALRAMRELPLADEDKLAVLMLLSGFTHSAAALERDLARHAYDEEQAAVLGPALVRFVTPERFPHLAPLVASGAYAGGPAMTGDDDITFGLERILDGIEAYLGPSPGPTPSPPRPGA